MNINSQNEFPREYRIAVTETFQRILEVKAHTVEEAIAQVKQKYQEKEIVLDSSDFVDYHIGRLY